MAGENQDGSYSEQGLITKTHQKFLQTKMMCFDA